MVVSGRASADVKIAHMSLKTHKSSGGAEPTLRSIRCPCCRAILYTLSTTAPGGKGGWDLTKDSPRVETDRDGPYMKCRRCSRRIALTRNRPGKGEPPIQVVPNQKCDRVLREGEG